MAAGCGIVKERPVPAKPTTPEGWAMERGQEIMRLRHALHHVHEWLSGGKHYRGTPYTKAYVRGIVAGALNECRGADDHKHEFRFDYPSCSYPCALCTQIENSFKPGKML